MRALRALRPLLASSALLAGLTAPAAGQDAVTWLRDNIGLPTNLHSIETWHPRGGEIYATDPLTLFQTEGATFTVPDAPARLIGLLERTQGRAAIMALIWSDAPVACGEDLATISVDTGLASFITPADLEAYRAFGTLLDTNQIDGTLPTVPFVVRLPGGAWFPTSGSGWGDGSYPVASLRDADGTMVALYAQFITDGQDWLLPPPCATLTS